MIYALIALLVPVLLIIIIAVNRQPSRSLWILTVIAFGSVIAYMWASIRWEIISVHLRSIIPILFLMACVFSYRRIRKPEKPQKRITMIFGIGLQIVLIIFFSGFNWFSFKGYVTPQDTIDIASPFRSGKQIVLNGGGSPFTNGHYHVKPQNHALDIVGLNQLGMRSNSIAGGATLDNYVIYGEPVYSPIAGKILIVVDEYDDQNPPKTDVEHPAGNHILIANDGIEILLAHFKKGSIVVREGDTVNTESLLGQVGNTGNTSEPHLHIHAETGGDPNTILNGKAVPFTINNEFLVRGDMIQFGK